MPSSSTYSYSLGKSLYIPLTSQCNSLTLPQTRGPRFLLPKPVVGALCRSRGGADDNKHPTISDSDEHKMLLPPRLGYAKEFNLYKGDGMTMGINKKYDIGNDNNDDGLFPSIHSLTTDIQKRAASAKSGEIEIDSIVFAGEGEPTLRLPALLHLAKVIHEYEWISNADADQENIPLRVVTNGLCYTFQRNVYNYESGKQILLDMKDAGIDSLSVALGTSCPIQYDTLMEPFVPPVPVSLDDNNVGIFCYAHDQVCEFIRDAVEIGLDVEVTGVDLPDIDKRRAQDLASELGVSKPFRWRPFFN